MTNLKINKSGFKLKKCNFVKEATSKDRIIIGNTYSEDMNHFIGWELRFGGAYKKTSMFTVRLDGSVYQHFSPNYYSEVFENRRINETSITILLENEGWLELYNDEKNEYITSMGYIYNRNGSVIHKKWRNKTYWAPYSEEQLESVYRLCEKLCSEFNIPLKAISHNTNIENPNKYHGVVYKSNFNKHHTDVNPNWDCNWIKSKLENIDYEN